MFLLITVQETEVHNTLHGERIVEIIVVQNYLYLLCFAMPRNNLLFLATNA
jgi:hypothetical protein